MLHQPLADQRRSARVEARALTPDELRACGLEADLLDRSGERKRPASTFRIVATARRGREHEAAHAFGVTEREPERRRRTETEPSGDDAFGAAGLVGAARRDSLVVID